MNAQQIELTEREYEDRLNEIYGTVDICGMTMNQGTVLKEMDPIAFRCGLSDEPLNWKCGECDNEYSDEDEANECCKPEEE